MKYRLKDNQLLILNDNGKVKENATENQHECFYCVEDKRLCRGHAENKKYGGQYCDWMKCKYEEIE